MDWRIEILAKPPEKPTTLKGRERKRSLDGRAAFARIHSHCPRHSRVAEEVCSRFPHVSGDVHHSSSFLVVFSCSSLKVAILKNECQFHGISMNIIHCCIRSLVLDSLQDLDESQHPGIQRLDTSMFTDDQIQDLFEQNASIGFYMTGMLWYSVIFWFLLALQLVGAMFSVAIFSASGEHRDHKGIIFAGHPRPKCPGTFSNCPTFGESLVSKSNIVFVLSFKIHPK